MHDAPRIRRAAWIATLAVGTAGLAWAPAPAAEAVTAHLHGRIVSVSGDSMVLRLRDGKQEKVDIAAARAAHHTGSLALNSAVIVYGTKDGSGVFHVISVGHASPDPKQWTPD